MSSDFSAFCTFSEGRIALPEGYQDRTVNAFTSAKEGDPALTIARDNLNDGEPLSDYIDRQLALVSQHLKGWKTEAREAIWLSDRTLEGESVQASFLREGQRIWQRQAVFALNNHRVLVFTLSKASALSAMDESRLNVLLGSFVFNQSP